MATTVGTVLTDLLDRIRDPNALMLSQLSPPTTADGQSQGMTLIGHAQNFINLAEKLVPITATKSTSANTVLYKLSTSFLTDCIKILRVYSSTQVLDGPCDFKAFSRASFSWLTDTGTTWVAWAQIGLDLLAMVPCQASSPVSVTIQYLNNIALPSSLATDMTVPDDTVEHVTRLAELFARIQSRQLDGFEDRLKLLQQSIELSAGTVDGGGKAL